MNKLAIHIQGSRFLNYLRYLTIFYFKKTISPFLYTGVAYLVYALTSGILDWPFPNYTITHIGVNLFFLIILITSTATIFSQLHSPQTSLQEYSIPISMEERYFGNFLFFGVVMLGLIYIIHAMGYGIMLMVGREDSDKFTSHLWGEYFGYNLPNLLLIYAYFFAGSSYFRKSPISKSIIIFIVALLASTLFFTLPYIPFSSSINIYRPGQSFSLESNPDSSSSSFNWFQDEENLNIIRNITYYLFLIFWFIGGYVKLRYNQFRA